MIRKILVVALIATSMAGCATKVAMAEKRDPVFSLHSKNIVERDLTELYSIPQ